jgi:hypothetical protein
MARKPRAADFGFERTQSLNELYSQTKEERARLEHEAITGPVLGFLGRLELYYMVYPIEGLMRLWYHLDPRIYAEPLRIRQVSEGRIVRKGNRHVLFTFYDRYVIPAFTDTVLEAIRRRGLNLVISTNARITPAVREALLARCSLLIERADLGRDFGGYKDGISIIQQRFGAPDRLILLNDSLFYFQEGLDDFVAALDGEADVIAMTEVFEHHYHLGGFALSLSGRALESRRVRKYWRKYRPIPTRRWSVHKGEVGLTRTLMKAGFKPHVLYHGARLLPHLVQLDSRQFLQAVKLLPSDLRRRVYVNYDEFQQEQRSTTLAAIGTFSRSMRRFENESDEANVELRRANIHQLLALNHAAARTHIEQESWARLTMCRDLVATIATRNQIHVGGFLFRKFLGMPAIKRDVFLRGVFQLEEVEVILSDLNEPLRDVAVADMRQRGTLLHYKGLRRILAVHGSI